MAKAESHHPLLAKRLSGVLLHPSSLPGGHGIGDIGSAAIEFVDFLHAAKQGIWQVLPTGPTAVEEYHSPYASLSAFAGNPLLVSLDALVSDGLLDRSDLERRKREVRLGGEASRVDFRAVVAFKSPLLKLAARNFSGRRADITLERFVRQQPWVRNYAQYAALRERFGKARELWPLELRFKPSRLSQFKGLGLSKAEIREQVVLQLLFSRQWDALRTYARSQGVSLFGDLPIYVSNDSADVWAHPEFFEVDRKTGAPTLVSGVPPDVFNAKGQLWGHPLYNWKAMERDRFRWWVDRFRALSGSFDIVRVDHFRAFESYWAVSRGSSSAAAGRWLKSPGEKLFSTVSRKLGGLSLFVEDLGLITPEVHALREKFALMGTRVLQFAFSGEPSGSSKSRHHPVNTPHHTVTYTATHDNAPVAEWFASLPRANQAKVRGLLNDCSPNEVPNQFVRLAMSLPARICILPMQDVLGVGKGNRMNYPGTASWKNWSWRFSRIPAGTAKRMAHFSDIFERNKQ